MPRLSATEAARLTTSGNPESTADHAAKQVHATRVTTSPDGEPPFCHHRLPGMSEGSARGIAEDVGMLAETGKRISFAAETADKVATGIAGDVRYTIE
ncbi:hypothetical protein [Saccharothrix coeruleofusca]|nr:hypothetical protein [Saccharothrix coeruleofusca]